MTSRLINYQWDGEAMVPLPKFRQECDRIYVIGEVYTLEVYEGERSGKDHGHYFALVADAWRHLPETIAMNFPTPEHLRKHALIMTGYRVEKSYIVETLGDAHVVARAATDGEEYAIVNIFGRVIQVLTAETQKLRRNGGMGKKRFKQSKQDVIDYIAGMIGVSGDQLVENFRRAA